MLLSACCTPSDLGRRLRSLPFCIRSDWFCCLRRVDCCWELRATIQKQQHINAKTKIANGTIRFTHTHTHTYSDTHGGHLELKWTLGQPQKRKFVVWICSVSVCGCKMSNAEDIEISRPRVWIKLPPPPVPASPTTPHSIPYNNCYSLPCFVLEKLI